MRGAIMTKETAMKFDMLNDENRGIVVEFIELLTHRQNESLTRKVISDANKGINLSEPFDNVNDLMGALNA